MSETGAVILADLTSWEAWVHLGAALRRKGMQVIRYTGSSGGRAQKLRVGLERVVFDQTHPVLQYDAHEVDVRPLLSALNSIADIQMVDAIGAVLTATREWEHHPNLHRVHSGLPETSIYDKWVYSAVAAGAGVRVPRTEEVGRIAAGDWVLKGRVGSGGDRVAMVSTDEDVTRALKNWGITGQDAFLQQRVGGELWNVGGVAHRGDVLVAAAYRAFSASADPEGPPVDIQIGQRPQQLEATAALVAALGYSGPFAVDFLDDGVPYLLDFNPRFFGTWAAMQAAGVDLLGAYLSGLGRPWRLPPSPPDESPRPSSATGATSIGAAWRRSRALTADIGDTVGPVASGVVLAEGLASARPGRGQQPIVTIAYSEPWQAALQWGAALRRRGLLVRRCTVPPVSGGQRARQRGESLCFDQTFPALRDDGHVLTVADPAAMLSDAMDVQLTERVLSAMLPTSAWQERPDLHHVPLDVDQTVLCDKGQLLAWARGEHVPVPREWSADEEPGVFPVIAKPAVGYGGVGVVICQDEHSLARAREQLADRTFVIQEFLPGRQVNVGGVALAGEVLLSAAYEPLPARDNPSGPPIAVRIVDSAQALQVAVSVVGGLTYTGPFCADLVADTRGDLRLVDFNARVFGSWTGLQRAGADVLGTYVHTLGLGPLPRSQARIGEEITVDLDPATPILAGLRAVMMGMRSLTGLRGMAGQSIQMVANHSRS